MNQGTRIGAMAESSAQEAGPGRECRDVEVSSVSQRRRWTAADKGRVLAVADACPAPGQVDALWRREGMDSAHLTTWRRPREHGMLEAQTPKKRGRQARGLDPLAQRVAPLERDHARLSQQLTQADTSMEVQRKSPSCWGCHERGARREGTSPGSDEELSAGRWRQGGV